MYPCLVVDIELELELTSSVKTEVKLSLIRCRLLVSVMNVIVLSFSRFFRLI